MDERGIRILRYHRRDLVRLKKHLWFCSVVTRCRSFKRGRGPARNRTWILSFGGSRTIHCTTRPRGYFSGSSADHLITTNSQKAFSLKQERCENSKFDRIADTVCDRWLKKTFFVCLVYFPKATILLPKILTAMASRMTPKNLRMAMSPPFPNRRSR